MGTSSNSASTSEKTLVLERGAASRLVHAGVVHPHPGGNEALHVETIGEMTVVFATLPWWRTPSLLTFPRSSRGLCYLPFQGWKNGVWHDGPLVRLNEVGDVTAFVALGGAARLTTPLESGEGVDLQACRQWLEDQDGEGAKISLTHALQAHCGELSQASLLLSSHSTREAVLCVLMRRAYPETVLAMTESSLTAPWRRLLQNLGILHGRAPVPNGPLKPVSFEALGDIVPTDRLPFVLQALQRPSEPIPPRLLNEARTAPKSCRAGDCARGG